MRKFNPEEIKQEEEEAVWVDFAAPCVRRESKRADWAPSLEPSTAQEEDKDVNRGRRREEVRRM